MKTIDWYILKKFLTAYFFVVLLLVAVVCIINLTEQNEKFIENNLGAKEIGGYYLDYAPYIANMITPITVFIAVVFITSKLATHTEIIAMLSNGISFLRLMRPYLMGAMIIAALSFYMAGWIIPDSNKDRVAFEVQYLKKPYHYSKDDIHMKIGPNEYAYMQNFNNSSNVGYKFTLEEIEGQTLKSKLVASRIEWNDETKKWTLKRWKKHIFNGIAESFEYGEEMDTTLRIHPKDFDSDYMLFESLTMGELNQKIDELALRGADDIIIYKVERYIRFMSPFTVIILSFIGFFMSSRKSRGGSGFQIAMGFLIAFIYIILYIFTRRVAETGSMDPLLAVWMPNIIFGTVGLFLYQQAPK